MIANFYHDPLPDTTLISLQQLEIRLKLPKDAEEVKLISWNKYRVNRLGRMIEPMIKWAESEDWNYYRITFNSMEPRVRYFEYQFTFVLKGEMTWLNAAGLHQSEPSNGGFSFSYAGDDDIISSPKWIADRVWYQVFPERFRNGNPLIDRSDTSPWGTEPSRHNYMGGDLQGIIEKLDYLQSLGINALYLNPLFTASSNHKYDTVNYFEIDPQFGTKEDLKLLVSLCHERDIKVILDLVINHCGYNHPYFQDVVANGERSIYWDWFYIYETPVELSDTKYDSVGYYEWMPKLRTSNPQVKKYIYDIVSFWQKETNIDGWRIDVADEMEISFLRALKSYVKELNPDSFIIAEIWYDAKRMMAANCVDSFMNYPLRSLLFDYILDRSLSMAQFHTRLVHLVHRYSLSELLQTFNLLGSHDTERILTRCRENVNDLRLLLAVQFVIPGNPVIYYGDELGLVGANDPYCRSCMPWDVNLQENIIFDTYKMWIGLRKQNLALQRGTVSLHRVNDNLYIIKRTYGSEELSLLLNFSEVDQELPTELSQFRDQSSGLRGQIGARQYLLLLN